jgi:hypothetical protein
MDRHAREVLRGAGVAVRTGACVSELRPGAPALVSIGNDPPQAFDRVVLALPLKRMRELPQLQTMALLRPGSRLSITPVTPAEWKAVVALLDPKDKTR